MATKPQLSERLMEEVVYFMENTPPVRLNMNLRHLFMNYLMFCQDGHGFDLDDLLWDLSNLMQLLDIAGGRNKRK